MRIPTLTHHRAALVAAIALSTLTLAALAPVMAAEDGSVPVGASLDNVDALQARGATPDLGSIWIGPWSDGDWGHLARSLDVARANGVMPVIHWWYWGDDISPSCVDNGCWGGLHGAHKDRATWDRMTVTLAQTVRDHLGDAPAVIVLESEFNKNGIQTWEAFDGHLADQAATIRAHAPNAKIVVGFGSWGSEHYGTFDRAIAAADYVGFQHLVGSTRDGDHEFPGAVDHLVSTSRDLQSRFGKPTFLVDFGVSSFGGKEGAQAQAMAEFADRLPELQDAGVRGVVYRDLADNPQFNTANYYGEAERHWGVVRADGSAKPAYAHFERALTGA